MAKHFSHLQTVEEIKAHYRRLAMTHHPDKGGDLRVMQEINAEYIEALRSVDGSTSQGSDGRDHTYKFDEGVETAIIEKIHEILAARLPGIEVSLIGTWIWITGDTKPVREQLKALKCKWHSTRECWFYNATPWHGGRSSASLAGLARRYGSRHFQSEDRRSLADR